MRAFLLTRWWRHVLWANDVKLLPLLGGKLKIKHLSSFITRGGGERMKGGITWFSGEQRGETVIAKRVQRGGGYRTTEHWLLMRGIIKILQSFGGRGGTRLISVWYNKNPPKHGKACMDGSTQKIYKWISPLDNPWGGSSCPLLPGRIGI